MPKGKKKYKSGRLLHQKQETDLTSDDESIADTSSVVSNVSELKIDSDDDTVRDEEDFVVDAFEDKLKEAIEGTSQKSLKGRIACLQVIRKSLSSRFISNFVADRKITMCDVVERSLKRGRGEEQAISAEVASLICTQLGSLDEAEAVFQSIQPLLLLLVADQTALPSVRAQCATALGFSCFVTCSGTEVIQSTMESLHNVFSASFFKGNGVAPTHNAEICTLHSSALLSWSLLLTVLSPPFIMDLVNTHLKKLPQLLESADVDLRIAAGETLAVFYELARRGREDFVGYNINDLCDKLRQLATDSQKFRAKKERKQQRSSFRDILRSIEEHEPLDIRIRFGKEILYIDNWCHKRQYDALCQTLGSGMNLHLMENELLRDIFELGTPLIDEGRVVKNSKLERHCAHLAANKARTVYLSKLRDKRADVMY